MSPSARGSHPRRMKIRARRAHTRGGADSVPPFRDFLFPPKATSICRLLKCGGARVSADVPRFARTHIGEMAHRVADGGTRRVNSFHTRRRAAPRNWAERPTVSRRVYVKNLAKKCLVVGIAVMGFASAKINLAADGAVYASDARASHTHGSDATQLSTDAQCVSTVPRSWVSIAEGRIRRAWRSRRVTGPCASSPICVRLGSANCSGGAPNYRLG